MAPSLDLLRTFLAVYRAGSVTHAAEVLGMAQPTVTGHVKALEASLGRPLFDRGARGVVPTPVADDLAQRLAGPLDAVDEVLAGELGEAAGAGRPVHLGGPAEFIGAQVGPALADLMADGLQLRTTFGLPDDLLPALAQGRLDLVVSSVRPRGRGVAGVPLCDETFVLVAGPRWPASRRAPLVPSAVAAALTRVPFLAYAQHQPIVRRYWRDVLGGRLPGPADVVLPDLRAVLAAVVAGAGVSVLPLYLCEAELEEGRLVALCEPDLPPINTLYLVRRAGATSFPALDRVVDRLLDRFRHRTDGDGP